MTPNRSDDMMRKKGPTIYTGEITTRKNSSRFWVKFLLIIIIAVALLLGLFWQDVFDRLYPVRPPASRAIDNFNSHCLGTSPPDIYQLSGLIVTLDKSNFPVMTVSSPATPISVDSSNTNPQPTEQLQTSNETTGAGQIQKPDPISEAHKEQNVAPETPATAQQQPIEQQAPEETEITPAESIDNTATRWIKAQKPNHYTLQIVSGRNRDALAELADKYLRNEVHAIYARELEGRPWYSLVVGSYPSAAAATRAVKHLPKGLQASKAWPKRFMDIHKQIEAE